MYLYVRQCEIYGANDCRRGSRSSRTKPQTRGHQVCRSSSLLHNNSTLKVDTHFAMFFHLSVDSDIDFSCVNTNIWYHMPYQKCETRILSDYLIVIYNINLKHTLQQWQMLGPCVCHASEVIWAIFKWQLNMLICRLKIVKCLHVTFHA